ETCDEEQVGPRAHQTVAGAAGGVSQASRRRRQGALNLGHLLSLNLEGTSMIRSEGLPYKNNDTTLNGFVAWDAASSESRPGVLVVHGGAGLDDHARNRALRFAESGFVVFACDMYGEGVAGDRQRVMQQIAEFRRNPDSLCQRAKAGLTVLN